MPRFHRCARFSPAFVVLALAGAAFGQDSVPSVPGGNDALSAYDTSTLDERYVVDLNPLTTSWGNAWWIAPVLKASRDPVGPFRTQILGSAAVSPVFKTGVTFPSTPFAFWNAAGQGVHPTANAAPGSVSVAEFDQQFGVAFSDLSLNPTNVVTATIGRDDANPSRLFVRRIAAASSRATSGAADTATLALGTVTPDAEVFFRADNFNTLVGTTTRISGDNILSFNPGTASLASVNTLFLSAGTNSATDLGATSYIVRNDTAPYNTPSSAWFTSGDAYALMFDLRAFFRSGSSLADLSSVTTLHRASGTVGHRGNPSFAPITPLGGTLGTVAALAKPTVGGSTALVNRLAAFGVNGSVGVVPTVAAGTATSFTLPSPISVPGFTGNLAGTAAFRQYLSQTSFRGANGPVGIGTNALGQLTLAAVATDPTADDFIAVVTSTGPGTSVWTIAAYRGAPVLNGPSGTSIGTLATPNVDFSTPAVDLLGNVYFTATWTPTASATTTGLFKAVLGDDGYEIEKLLSVGDSFVGANSTRTATISAITLNDADSVASGALHSASLLQQQVPGATTTNPADAKAVGGVIVTVILTYDNAGTNEAYDAVLLLTPQVPATSIPCPLDADESGGIDVTDLFLFLDRWFAQNGQSGPGLTADFDSSGTVDVTDLFDYLDGWFALNGTNCP